MKDLGGSILMCFPLYFSRSSMLQNTLFSQNGYILFKIIL